MSSREEENAAAAREPKRKGACPYCWSYSISYNERSKIWGCQKCERSFQIPSYGQGGSSPPQKAEPMGFLTSVFEVCPNCNERSLIYRKSELIEWEYYKCKNENCGRVFGVEELNDMRGSTS
ncbi:hypothetical protein [Dehalogenimonas etheniformans]|uniref:hypothetical protein n=1 Tax=Dehalogenimonas etheniformans TaxID=1536648 RepID=UPI001392455E|nr:hypothetical protein [Dehalogenimonas etheniformans]QNT76967.1 hypothetical protein HX448_09920 [Dehalogenimonas etheniformans]